MKKALILLLVAALLLTSAAQASNYFEDCDYYRQHGVHNFKDLYWATHPSCTEVGVMWVECKTCGYTAIAPRDTAPHNYGPWTEIKAATDNSKGMRSHKCKDCGASATEEFYPSGTVYPGRNKEAIIELQEMLAELGLLARVTGEYDKATEDALRTVQKEANSPHHRHRLAPNAGVLAAKARRQHHCPRCGTDCRSPAGIRCSGCCYT